MRAVFTIPSPLPPPKKWGEGGEGSIITPPKGAGGGVQAAQGLLLQPFFRPPHLPAVFLYHSPHCLEAPFNSMCSNAPKITKAKSRPPAWRSQRLLGSRTPAHVQMVARAEEICVGACWDHPLRRGVPDSAPLLK